MSSKRFVILLASFIALLILLGFFAPIPRGDSWLLFHSHLALNTLAATTLCGAAVLFLRGLAGFSASLKRSYLLICLGLIAFGLSQIQLPLAILFGTQNTDWYTIGLSPIINVAAIFVLYAGIRSFARLFDIKNFTTSWWASFGIFAIAALGVTNLPHAANSLPESELDVVLCFTLLPSVFIILSSAQIIQVKQIASAIYTRALAWLFIGVALLPLTGISYLSFFILVGDTPFFLDANPLIVGVLFSLAGCALIRSAVAFSHVTSAHPEQFASTARTFFGQPKQVTHTAAVSSFEIIVHAAGFASNTRAIDPLLDPMRVISSQLSSSKKLTPTEERTLMEVYRDIEKYLLTKEKVRQYDQSALRQRIAQDLNISVENNLFWKKITQSH